MNMKKLNIFAVLLITLTLIFTACSNEDKNESEKQEPEKKIEETEEKTEESGVEGKLADAYFKIMRSDDYMMKYKTTSEIGGETYESEATMAISGDKTYMASSDAMANKMIIITKDDKTYMVNDAERTVTVFEDSIEMEDEIGETEESFENQGLETEGMVFVKSGKDEFRGKTYDYEEYKIADGEMDYGQTRYYFDKKDLIAMETIMGEDKVVLEILEISDKVDGNLFEIPDDYEIMNIGM